MNLKERVKLIFTSKSKLNARIKYLEEQLKTYRDDRVSVITITKELNAENDHLLKTIKDTDQKIQHYRNLIDYICDVFWFTQYTLDNWDLWVAWDKWLLDEIIKARKNLNKKSKK